MATSGCALSHLSSSSINEYLQCPRRFRLRRLDRVTPSHRSAALALGSAIHAGIGAALFQHGSGETVSAEAVFAKFRDTLNSQLHADGVPVLFDHDEDEGALVDAGVRMLSAFFQRVPLPDRVIAIERPFEVELFDPQTGEVLPLMLVGSIDALVEHARRLVMQEFKSCKRRYDEHALSWMLQPTAYRFALRSEGVSEAELQLVALTKTQKVDVQVEALIRTRADEAELLDTAACIYRAIQHDVFPRQKSAPWMCSRCEFAGVCR